MSHVTELKRENLIRGTGAYYAGTTESKVIVKNIFGKVKAKGVAVFVSQSACMVDMHMTLFWLPDGLFYGTDIRNASEAFMYVSERLETDCLE